MRITEAQRFDLLQVELKRTSGALADQTERLATGRAINRLSDDPELAVQADRLRVEDNALSAYSAAADNATAWLNAQDGALQSAVNVLHRVRELAVSAGAPMAPEAREGIAVELEGLSEQLVDIANTKFHGRAVFAGFGERAVEMSAGTVNFVGDAGEVRRRVGHDRVVRINVSGSEAFGFDAGDDAFGIIADLAAHVRSADVDQSSGSDLDRIAAASGRLSEALGGVGARTNQVSNAINLATARRDDIRGHRSSIVDADLAETALEMTQADSAYQAVLAATSRLQRPTLVDYLR